MKLKVLIVDLEIPPRVKKWGLRIGIPLALLLGGGAVAWAAGLHTWMTGDALQASDLNGNFAQLQNEITTTSLAPRTPSAFHAWLSVSTSVPTGGATVVFDHLEYDLGGEYGTSTGAFVPNSAGIYLLTCQFEFNPGAAGADIGAVIYKNGSTSLSNQIGVSELVTNSTNVSQQVSVTAQLAAHDSVTCFAINGGASVTLQAPGFPGRNQFSAARLY
jgi:C1q domain